MTRLRIGTYNIHGCVGVDGRRVPERTVRTLQGLDASVVGLQEVDSRGHTDPIQGQLGELASGVGMMGVAGPTLRGPHGHYGNGLLTRLPVNDIALHDLSVPGREPRGALVVELQTNSGALHVLVTHLGLAARERRDQLERLAAITAQIVGPLVVLGDFNEWTHSRLRRQPFAAGAAAGPRTFPSWCPVLPLDAIFVRPAGRLERIERLVPRERGTSDHLPLVATLCDPRQSASARAGPA